MNKTVKNSAIYLTGTIVMAVLGFLNTILLTRVLSQQVYAMYGLLTTFVSTAGMFIAFGYDASYMRFYYNNGYSQKKFFLMTLKVPAVVFVVFLLLVIEPTRTFITYIMGEKLSCFSIALLLLYVFFHTLHRFTQLTARMEEKSLNYVVSNIMTKSGFIVVVFFIYFIIKDVSFDWVIISFVIASLAGFLINLIVVLKNINKVSKSQEKTTEKELLSYGFPSMINNVIILVVPLIEKIIIRDLAGWEILGIYTAAAVFQTVMLLVANTITNIWNPIVFKHCDNEEKFKPIMHNFGLVATIVVTMCMAGCVLLRRWLVLLLDESYYTIYIIAPTILYGACLHIISLIYAVGINIKKKTSYLVLIPVIQLVLSVVFCYLLIPNMGLVGVAIATFISISLSKIFKMILGIHFYDSGVSEWKASALCAAGMAASLISLFFTSFISDVLLSMALIIVILVVVNKELIQILKTMPVILKGRK